MSLLIVSSNLLDNSFFGYILKVIKIISCFFKLISLIQHTFEDIIMKIPNKIVSPSWIQPIFIKTEGEGL